MDSGGVATMEGTDRCGSDRQYRLTVVMVASGDCDDRSG